MPNLPQTFKKHRETLLALAAAAVCFCVLCLIWLAAVRPNAAKSLSQKISDDYTLYSAPLGDGESAQQTFTTSEDLYAMAFVFATDTAQPTGTLELTLADADTGELLGSSTGEMANILAGQYTGLGLDAVVPGVADRHYLVTLTPHYTGDGRLCVGHSDGAALWGDDALTVNSQPVDGTLALLITTQRIGGFLTRFFLLVGLAVCVIVFCGVRAALRGQVALHRLVFALVLAFGMVYSVVLPPYAAPDEKYHINQSFTLACRWANFFSSDSWRMGDVPITTSYRRAQDFNTLLQDENTTVFTWRELTDNLFTVTTDSFDSHMELDELQTDRNPILYLPSAAMVLLCFVLHLGFVPTLLLGRLVNLLAFAALAGAAVRFAPFGKRVFAAAALLPMTLHLAASFSRDAVLLGLCFAFTALCADAIFGRDVRALPPCRLLALAALGLALAPAKAVYLPLAALALLAPSVRLGASPALKKAAYLAACLLLAFALNTNLTLGGAAAEPTAAPAAATAVTQDAPASVPASSAAAIETDAIQPAEIPPEFLENTAENFVRRLYRCAENVEEIPQKELDFWVQALRDGDVTPALLGQSFFFGSSPAPAAMTDAEFLSAVTLVYLNRDAMYTDADAMLALVQGAEHDRRYAFKAIYASEEAANLLAACDLTPGCEDAERYPLDRSVLMAEVEAARAVRASQSTATEADRICYTPGYILTHPLATALLLVRSVIANGDHYLRTLVGGSLSYYTLDLAWGWVAALYLLLAFAALPAQNELDTGLLPQGRYRVWGAVAALACCALAVAGCITWTPTYYETIYGLQGRYFLPVLPLLLITCMPRLARVGSMQAAAARLVCGLCLVNAGVLVNCMLAVIAR